MEEDSRKEIHGALILTSRRELCMQIYSEIQKLDPKSKIRVARLGSIQKVLPQVTLDTVTNN